MPQSNFHSVNIRDFFVSPKLTRDLQTHIESFSCPRNPGIERFLKRSAVEFTKQDISVTHLVFPRDNNELLGYFSLAIRPVRVPVESVSKSMGKRLERAGRFDRDANVYNVAAYLIAQLGKNYTDGANERITGEELLFTVWELLKEVQYDVGGSIVFVEAEKYPGLLNFYRDNAFRAFGERKDDDGEDLVQFVRALRQ